MVIFQPSAKMTLEAIVGCERMGVPEIWIPSLPLDFDPLPILSAASVITENIKLGTGIAINYIKHPAAMASEVMSIAELAPGRFRLGVGSSHPFIISGMYGVPFGKPVQYMREYITVLRQLLWDGYADFDGEYFHTHGKPFLSVEPPRIPIFLAALRKPMLRLGGEVADGLVTGWSPISYLIDALPEIKQKATESNRQAPTLIPSLSILWHPDRAVAKQMANQALAQYLAAPAYLDLFAQAGYPIENGEVPDGLFEELFAYGTPEQIADRIQETAQRNGVDELMLKLEIGENPPAEFMGLAEIVGSLSGS